MGAGGGLARRSLSRGSDKPLPRPTMDVGNHKMCSRKKETGSPRRHPSLLITYIILCVHLWGWRSPQVPERGARRGEEERRSSSLLELIPADHHVLRCGR